MFFAALLCSVFGGCTEIEQAAVRVRDPNSLLYCFAVVAGTITVLLAFLGHQGLWKSLLNGLRYTGAVALTASPLYAVMMDSTLHTIRPGIAMGFTGLIAIGVSSFLLWETKRSKSDE
ncbi:hypothetical protein KBA73_05700 [Patescibacteria group bacterium]|nr:hypothetical protein [Patescibacteria group bacterium]